MDVAAAEQVLNLFDSYWFHHQIMTKQPPPSTSLTTPDVEIETKPLKPVISCVSSSLLRSLSDQLSSETSFSSMFSSPKSVLSSHKLQTIHSGKEDVESPMKVEEEGIKMEKSLPLISPKKQKLTRRRKKKGSSKSLSDLEFEELKGFMDLGFVFSEEDKNSDLVSIIPGLHRLGKTDDHETKEEEEEEIEEKEEEHMIPIPRPYLSEAWDVMERERKQQIQMMMMNWRIPALSGEIDMKIHLKNWAHTVASTAAATVI